MRRLTRTFGLVGGVLILGSLVFVAGGITTNQAQRGRSVELASPPMLRTLLGTAPEALAAKDIAAANLACADGLPGAEDLDTSQALRTLDAMAAQVRKETERHFYRFKRNPADFESSEGYFRMLMLVVVLAEDFQVHYSADKIAAVVQARMDDGFFADSRTVFLHGLTGPKHEGTCSSMPVLYVAVGRRLGYPLKLVTTKGHLFVRWEGDGERFNIEATGHGVNRFQDDYYRHWPFEISHSEEVAEGYLKSLTPAEEFAAFLSIRAMCLRQAGRQGEAAEAFSAAARSAPGCRSYTGMAASLRTGSYTRPQQTETRRNGN
jgi:hypothetical protein